MVAAGAVKRPYWYVLAGRGCGCYVGDVLESLYQCDWTFPASVGGSGSLYGSDWTVVASVGPPGSLYESNWTVVASVCGSGRCTGPIGRLWRVWVGRVRCTSPIGRFWRPRSEENTSEDQSHGLRALHLLSVT